MRGSEIAMCPDCGDAHMGRCGGLTFAQRLRSVRLDTSVTPTRTPRRYYDAESLDDMFGEDEATRIERYNDDTKGRGFVKREEMNTLSPEDFDFYTAADREEDGDAA